MSTQHQENTTERTTPSPLAYAIAWVLRPLAILAAFAVVGIAGTIYFGAGTPEHTAFAAALLFVTAIWLSR